MHWRALICHNIEKEIAGLCKNYLASWKQHIRFDWRIELLTLIPNQISASEVDRVGRMHARKREECDMERGK